MSRVTPLAVALVVGAFALGSIPFGVILAKRRGVDLKKVGSGNIGATNAARALGKKAGMIVLVLDVLKAFAPTLATLRGFHAAPAVAAAVGFAAFLGHIYSPWMRFRGGKGVACALGAFLALAPVATLMAGAVCAVVVLVTRIGSLGSLLGMVALMPALVVRKAPPAYLELAVAMFVLIVWRHRDNLRRLAKGEENKL
jgi:acyl phosphate:glycerol-3-phosphate acyltransferase